VKRLPAAGLVRWYHEPHAIRYWAYRIAADGHDRLYSDRYPEKIMSELQVLEFAAPLMHEGKVVRINLPTVSADDIRPRLIRQGQSQP
jgi:hypothetical protein